MRYPEYSDYSSSEVATKRSEGPIVEKELTTSNLNVNLSQSNKTESEFKVMLQYDDKLYIPEFLLADLLERTHYDPLDRHFAIEKTLELLIHKYYWPR